MFDFNGRRTESAVIARARALPLFLMLLLFLAFKPADRAFSLPPVAEPSHLTVCLEWEGDHELELHLTVFPKGGERFHLHPGRPAISGIGRLDISGKGQVLSLCPRKGHLYQFYVLIKRAEPSQSAQSPTRPAARVSVLANGKTAAAFTMPESLSDNLWTVFSYCDGAVTHVNALSNVDEPEQIGTDLEGILIPGDILLGATDNSLVPGMWSHVAIYAGDRTVVEAFSENEPVGFRSLDEWEFPEMKWVTALRVVSADRSVRMKAVRFAREKAARAEPYNKNIFTKRTQSRSWYCSELIWAAYMNASRGKIDLESSPDVFGVYPWEIERSHHVAVVGGHYEKKPARTWRLGINILKFILRHSTALLGENGILGRKSLLGFTLPHGIFFLIACLLLCPETVALLRAAASRQKPYPDMKSGNRKDCPNS